MTTAARPTWAPAKGGNEQGGTRIFGPSQKYSSRDLAAHTNLKPRRDGQDTQDELQKRDLREELEDRERRHFTSKDKSYGEDRDRRKGGHLLLEGSKREAEDRIIPRSVDADDSDVDVKSDDESDEDDDDDEEDDTEALLAELEQIKRERAEEKMRKERQQQEEELKTKEAELMRGNPLINNVSGPTNFNVKRRWDDDVVFKNQARGESKAAKRFINDTIRNDFHRKFLHKYMK
ncbi:Protein CWC15-like protein A [Bienertia sinuspersici]